MLYRAMQGDELLQSLFADAVADDELQLSRMTAALEDADWDALAGAVLSYAPMRRGRCVRQSLRSCRRRRKRLW